MRIYLCARYCRAGEMHAIAGELSEAGHVVTSSWHSDRVFARCREGETSEERDARCALRDLWDLGGAHALVLFSEDGDAPEGTRGGRWVEFGIAWASGLRLIVVGRRENVFTQVASRVEAVPDVVGLMALLPPVRVDQVE